MDKRILISLAAIIVLVALILIFRNIIKPPCEINILISPQIVHVGEEVLLISNNENTEWHFIDGSILIGDTVQHIFKDYGQNIIKINTEASCRLDTVIIVKPNSGIEKRSLTLQIPKEIVAGTQTEMKDLTPEANSWEWKVNKTGERGNQKTFTPYFFKPGHYIISLKIKGEQSYGDTLFTVFVKQNSKKENPPKPNPTDSSNDNEFKTNFLLYSNSKSIAENKWRDFIQKKGCSEYFIITLNEKNQEPTKTNSTSFRDSLSNNKYEVLEVSNIHKDEKRGGCIDHITVKVKSKKVRKS